MPRLEMYFEDGSSSFISITDEQEKDISWLAETTSETYPPIHEMMMGIRRCFDMWEKEKKSE